jgi:hypothetical protein
LADEAWCNVCRWHGPSFVTVDRAECPRCGADARERYVFWCFARRTPAGLGHRVLETGPRLDREYRRAMRGWFDYRPVRPLGRRAIPAPTIDEGDAPAASCGFVLSPGDLAGAVRSVDVLLGSGGFAPAADSDRVPDADLDDVLDDGLDADLDDGLDDVLEAAFRVLAPGGRAFLLTSPLPGDSRAPTPGPGRALAVDAERLNRHGFRATALVASTKLAPAPAPAPAPALASPCSPAAIPAHLARATPQAVPVAFPVTGVLDDDGARRLGIPSGRRFLVWECVKPMDPHPTANPRG